MASSSSFASSAIFF
jgi:hypothetical protein